MADQPTRMGNISRQICTADDDPISRESATLLCMANVIAFTYCTRHARVVRPAHDDSRSTGAYLSGGGHEGHDGGAGKGLLDPDRIQSRFDSLECVGDARVSHTKAIALEEREEWGVETLIISSAMREKRVMEMSRMMTAFHTGHTGACVRGHDTAASGVR
jgi:hypothetical protein